MSMPYVQTIDQEANVLVKLATDLDKYRRYYSLKEVDTDETIFVKFVAPKIIAFEDYRFYLLKNSDTKPLSPANYYRPDYVSYQEYGTVNLWAMLLFINDIPTIEDFEKESILVPTQRAILEVSRNVLTRNLVTELVPLSDLPPAPTPPLFSRVTNTPLLHSDVVNSTIFIPSDIYFLRELFNVDNIISRQKYVDLKYEPVPESLTFKIKDHPNYIYGKHYTIIKGSKANNRLTWDPKRIPNGIGLVSTIIEGVTFEVNYARKVIL